MVQNIGDTDKENKPVGPDQELVSWIMSRIDKWRSYRNENYSKIWKQYRAKALTKNQIDDKSRASERSRIINPALAQALESAVADIEEAIFGKDGWFDLQDDALDTDQPGEPDTVEIRRRLLSDIKDNKLDMAIADTFYYGGLYGTLVTEIKPELTEEKVLAKGLAGTPVAEVRKKFHVRYEPVPAYEFLIEPTARGPWAIKESLGVGRETVLPRHQIKRRQAQGVFRDVDLSGNTTDDEPLETTLASKSESSDSFDVINYWGLVPRQLLQKIENKDLGLDSEIEELREDGLIASDEEDELPEIDVDVDDLVEAVVVIANQNILLKAKPNPFLLEDRPFSYAPWDINPDDAFGRGIAAKGFETQKEIDAATRARVDAMGLVAHPMMAVNRTSLLKGQNLSVRAGKTIYTTDDPRASLFPLNFGGLDPSTFAHTGDLERQLQMATGILDSASSPDINPRNATLGGISIIQGAAVKRTKRILRKIESYYLSDLIQKTYRMYVQFDSRRYNIIESNFSVRSGLGVVARELEQSQLIQLLSLTDQQSPLFGVILQGIFDNSSLTNKAQLLQALKASQEVTPEQQAQIRQQQQLSLASIQAEMSKTASEVQKNQSIARHNQALADELAGRLNLDTEKHRSSFAVDNAKIQTDIFKVNKDQETAIIREKIRLFGRQRGATEDQINKAAVKSADGEPDFPGEATTKGLVINNIIPNADKKITVKRTSNGLEGTSEAIKDEPSSE